MINSNKNTCGLKKVHQSCQFVCLNVTKMQISLIIEINFQSNYRNKLIFPYYMTFFE